MTDPAEPQPSPTPQSVNIWLAIGAGFVALLLVAGAVALIARRRGGETLQPATTDQRPELTAPRLEWNRVPDTNKMFSSEPTQVVEAVASTAVGYIAVGIDNPSPDYDAAVWRSDDGINWSWVKDELKVLATSEPEAMLDVLGYDDGAVAVGFEGRQGAANGAVWRTNDGQSWRRSPDVTGELGGSGDQIMAGVADFGGRLVAVGREGSTDTGEPAAWYSDDGDSWRRASFESNRPEWATSQVIESVAAGAEGLVAVGRTIANGNHQASAWWSSDGRSWESISSKAFSAKRTQVALSVAAATNGFIAVGSAAENSNSFSAAVWLSPDGKRWEIVHGTGEAGSALGSGQVMEDVDTYGDLIVATGWAGEAGRDNAAVWTSRDGREWVHQPDAALGTSGEQRALCVAVDSSMVIAAGIDGPRGQSDATIWFARREAG